MKSSKLDQFTILATVVGFGVDLSTVGEWINTDGVSTGSSGKPGLLLALLSFYSLTLVSFVARRLLYKHKANQSRIQLEKSKPQTAARSAISGRDIPITRKQKHDIETAVIYITCLAASIVLWPPLLSVDWVKLQDSIYPYGPPSFIAWPIMFILSAVPMSILVARQLYISIVGFD